MVAIISRLFRRMSSRARSRSDDSRVSRAWTSGGLSVRDLEEGGGAMRPRDEDENDEPDERLASCRSIDVRGSCALLRFSSRFLEIL